MKKEIPLDLKNLKGVNSENLRKDYPSEFFNIDFYNNISFVIYKHLNLAFENANQLLINNNPSITSKDLTASILSIQNRNVILKDIFNLVSS